MRTPLVAVREFMARLWAGRWRRGPAGRRGRGRFGCVAAFLTAACAGAPQDPTRGATSALPGDDTDGLFRPDQIQAILRDSRRTYRVTATARVAASELPDVIAREGEPDMGRVDPFLEVHREEGKLELRSHPPGEALDALFTLAGEAFAARDYEGARRLYAQAVEAEPSYFKSYTYLGNALYFLGRYVEAEQVFLRALELNPFDYQAHLFLGDTLHQLGSYRRAKEALTRAFVLNRENEVVAERLRTTLAKMDLTVRESRIAPPVRIEPDQGDDVLIRLDRREGPRWYALAACLACWAYEERCQVRASPEEDPLRLAMYRECLLNQAASIAARQESEEEVSSDEHALLAAIEDGYLEAIVFWEVVAARAPAVILLLPEGLQEDIRAYIERYVFVTTQLVRSERHEPSRRFALR